MDKKEFIGLLIAGAGVATLVPTIANSIVDKKQIDNFYSWIAAGSILIAVGSFISLKKK